MLQFHLSKDLASDMKVHLASPQAINPASLQWYGHRVTIMRRKCVLMMELQSRYCMIFTGMTKPDFERFPERFIERLWHEAVSICQLDDERSEMLAELVFSVAEDQHYQVGYDLSVQSHIRQMVEEIKSYVHHYAGRLPASDEEMFALGVNVNERIRKRKGDKDYFVPLKVFRDFWLGMLALAPQDEVPDVGELPDNVVPFRR